MTGSGYYVNELLHLRCGAEMLRLQLFPNFKEAEESFAAYAAAIDMLCAKGLGAFLGRRDVVALRTAWKAHSIDPIADEGSVPRRCWQHRARVEGVDIEALVAGAALVVVLAVHSHAALNPLWERLAGVPALLVVAMPCCFSQYVEGVEPDLDYEDPGVSSPKRRVLVWCRGFGCLKAFSTSTCAPEHLAPR